MSSYYSQSIQYKLQGSQQSNYVQHQAPVSKSIADVGGSIHTRKRLSNATGKSNGAYSSYGSTCSVASDVTSSSASAKKMAHYSTKAAGKRGSGALSGQKAGVSASAYVEYEAAGANGGAPFNKFEVQNPSPKINSHLLDHGYGATPQPSLDDGDAGCGSSTVTTKRPADGSVITSYYKVSAIRARSRSGPALTGINLAGGQASGSSVHDVAAAGEAGQTYAAQGVDVRRQEALLGRNKVCT